MSKKLTFTYLSEPDVRNAGLTLSETVDLCKEALRQHGLKKVENPPKFGVHTREDSFIHSMPGKSMVYLRNSFQAKLSVKEGLGMDHVRYSASIYSNTID